MAGAIAKTLRQVDVTGRYGGEEFVALLPETAGDVATEVAERVREAIWHLAIPHEKSPAHRVTVSIGVADSVGRNLATTIGAADHGLYMAKRYGRNVVLGPPASRSFQASQAAGAGSIQGRRPAHAADALATTAETRDHLTVQHVHRVSRIAGVIAEQMRRRGCPEPISDEFIHNLVLAAPLHDIGKMAIPDAILKKPDKLTIHEMAIMKTHCELGVDLFNRLVVDSRKLPFALVVVDVILSHHERFDGRGYPQGLRGTQIPLAGRIVAVADAYDAITNDRVYRKARTHDEALKIIARERGGQFDPEVVDAFLECQQDIRNLASMAS